MGNVHYVARTNQFWIKNLNDFKEGLKGYIGGEHGTQIRFFYHDYKKRSKQALIDMNSEDFADLAWNHENSEHTLDILEYIKTHIVEGEECTIHLVSYEHAGDMSITKYVVSFENIQQQEILE